MLVSHRRGRAQNPGPSCSALPGALAGCWMGSGTARTQTSPPCGMLASLAKLNVEWPPWPPIGMLSAAPVTASSREALRPRPGKVVWSAPRCSTAAEPSSGVGAECAQQPRASPLPPCWPTGMSGAAPSLSLPGRTPAAVRSISAGLHSSGARRTVRHGEGTALCSACPV